ncbi:hypothetical protein [Nonomuraea sp. SYSU D8015]|uniref:hypothetical protein n=1 Tax=Nonomuraea sp. SYSU D8015 TaxID=2593644 RepID=UPI00166035B0|nr:hypothetical protein [Nonomuraea sp. SYSU D8015]
MNELKNLARVHDEDLAGQASGAGARALLASITAEEPAAEPAPWFVRVARRRPARRRLALAAAAVAGLVTAAVVGPTVLGERGPATSYASAAIDIELRGDTYVATIKDPFADHAKYTEGFKAVGLNVNLEVIPASPSRVGKIAGMSLSGPLSGNGRSIEAETAPEGCAFGQDGCAMTVRVPHDWAGWARIQVGRSAKPGEKYRNLRPATVVGEMLEGYRADEKTVGEVVAEVQRRGLKAVFQIVLPSPGGEGYSLEPEGARAAEVGDDWIVWDAQSSQAGVVRLLVTKERLPKNPIHSGRPPVG